MNFNNLRLSFSNTTLTNQTTYSFQGQERDDEVKGAGNSVNYTFRMHDPRVGRFFAVDPISQTFAFYSPYLFSGNCVINSVEIEGKEPDPVFDCGGNHKEGERVALKPNSAHNNSGWTIYVTYHVGGKFTQSGWYTEKDYNFITKKVTQNRDDATWYWEVNNPSKALKIGSPDWDNDGDISSYASVASTNAKIAGEDAETMKAEANDGTVQNAFRHALWQSIITYEIGYSTAEKIGYSHETHPNADILLQDKTMNELIFENVWDADEVADLMNNRIARQLGQIWKNDEINLTRKNAAIKTLKYFHEKGFYVIKNNNDGSFGIERKKLTNKEFSRGLKNLSNTDKNGFNKKDGDLYESN